MRVRAGATHLRAEILDGDRPDIVLHWGMLGDRTLLRPLARHLDGCGRRILLDGRGYGESEPAPGPFTLWEYADDLAQAIAEVTPHPVVFVGQSAGAMTALRVALTHPHRIAGLVLADTSAAPEDPEQLPLYELLLDALRRDGISDDLMDLVASTTLMSPGFFERRPDRVEQWRARMRPLDIDSFVNHARAVFDRDDLRPRLGEITVPTLVIVGSDDAATPPARSHELADGLGGPVDLVELPEAGHFAVWEQPERTAEAVRRFLQTLPDA